MKGLQRVETRGYREGYIASRDWRTDGGGKRLDRDCMEDRGWWLDDRDWRTEEGGCKE